MSILDRAELEASPLADLHAIASELSIDGYRRLRRVELIDVIVARQSGSDADVLGNEDVSTETADDTSAADQPPSRRRASRGRRGGRGRSSERDEERDDEPEREGEEADEQAADAAAEAGRETVEGIVEVLPNGSGFLRVDPPEPSDDDVYVSAAQVKRCELVSGDRISGPRRPPRRSERFASLIRIETVNDRPASELAGAVRFDDLPVAFPGQRFRLGSDDPTVKAIEWLTPMGLGSRVTIVGKPQAGKTEALRRLCTALAQQDGLEVLVALAGVRPEEIRAWGEGPVEPAGAVSFAASPDAQGQVVERVVDQGRRLAARGADVALLIDTISGLHPHAARKALAAARNILDGGSLTVVATSQEPCGGETTVIALDSVLASTGRFPALDLASSWTIRAELLVGEAGADAIARARAEAMEGS